MNTQPSIKLIKKQGKAPKPQATAKSAAGPKRWSAVVQSWVSEFHQHRREEKATAFDMLFK